jgi:adenylate cyclase
MLPSAIGARASKIWYGPVLYRRDSEPYMIIALAGNRATDGIAIAEINLKLIWDVITAIKIGNTGRAFVVDNSGRLIAHPDISRVLRGDVSTAEFNRLKSAIAVGNGSSVVTTGDEGQTVVAASVRAADVGWTVIAQQPISEAFASIRAMLWRSLALILIGIFFAAALAYSLALRMSGPIRQLEEGVQRIGASQFDHRIKMSSAAHPLLLKSKQFIRDKPPCLDGFQVTLRAQLAYPGMSDRLSTPVQTHTDSGVIVAASRSATTHIRHSVL